VILKEAAQLWIFFWFKREKKKMLFFIFIFLNEGTGRLLDAT
jgi:hypothetical protein